MAERVLVTTAWPYANGPLHLGHIAGCYLPADIFARYHRAHGDDVLMVSGSDQHGTPVTVRAEQEGTSPAEVAQRYHESFLQTWQQLGISFDLFTRTGTENHARVVHGIFRKLLDLGYLYRGSMPLPYCPQDERFLPDRYVTGICPNCGSDHARGDQCDECGRPLNATELLNPRCVFCGTTPEIRDSEHIFLKLSAFNQRLLTWVRQQTQWRPNVYNFTERFLAEGLHDRAITRDIEWGVPVPLEGWERKRIYVWFEAVIGYLSASIEWAERRGEPDAWKRFWQDPACPSHYFIGKDNIPFHTIIWPAMLMGQNEASPGEELNLPYDVPANEFLGLEGRQFSTSRNWAVWAPDFLERYDPDPLRYALAANMPEAGDTDFSWREFVRRNNDELVATYGNLVHRVLTFTYRNFDKRVPEPREETRRRAAGEITASTGTDLLQLCRFGFQTVGDEIAQSHFRLALRNVMALAHAANQYLDQQEPWKTLRSDRQQTADVLYEVLSAISALKQLFYPFLPFSSQKLHTMLGREGTPQDEGWQLVAPKPGQLLGEPSPLFTKLDDAVVEQETAKLGQPA